MSDIEARIDGVAAIVVALLANHFQLDIWPKQTAEALEAALMPEVPEGVARDEARKIVATALAVAEGTR